MPTWDQTSRLEILNVTHLRALGEEPLGARDKLWLAGDSSDEPVMLWKAGRETGIPEPGADLCAEVIAARLADLIRLPAARVEFATRGSVRGVVSHHFCPSRRLVHGNELLPELHADYDVIGKGHVKGYDLASIRAVLEGYGGYFPAFDAFDSFVGLLVFDAFIGNTDRHHENWAVIEEDRVLAPSFDHGASLGFNVPRQRLGSPIAAALRGNGRHFLGAPGLVDLAVDGLAMVPDAVASHWINVVASLNLDDVQAIVGSVPPGWMSEARRMFVTGFVAENQRRLTA